jgi:hypothetical protein
MNMTSLGKQAPTSHRSRKFYRFQFNKITKCAYHKLTSMKEKINLYLYLIPHFQRIQMYHTIPKNLVSNLFQFEIVHEKNISWDHALLMVSLIIDFDKFQNIPHNCFPHYLTPPLVYLMKTPKHGWGHG